MVDIFTPEQKTAFSFPVKREKLMNPAGKDTGCDTIYRLDSGMNLGVVSREYELVSHKSLITTVLKQFEENKLPKVEPVKIAVSNEGGRLFAEFKFDGKFDLGIASTENKKVGDFIAPGFRILNSYDRSLEYSLSLFCLRLACTNGMMTTEQLFSGSRKHLHGSRIDGMVDDFIEKYSGLEAVLIPAIRELSDKEVTPSHLENQLNELPAWFRTEAIDYLQDNNLVGMEEGEEGTELVMMKKISEWDFYNSLTYVLSHSEGLSEENKNRQGNLVASTFGL